jgi:hypothetical protein
VDTDSQQQEIVASSKPEIQPDDGSVPLAIAKNELYAQYRALAGLGTKEAYIKAGGKAEGERARRQGYKLSQRTDVKRRIRFLKAKQADALVEDNVMGRREILQELKTNMELGRAVKGGLTASNRALELIGGEEHDMFVVRKENRNKKIDELDGLDPGQLIDYIQRAADRIPGLEIDAESLAAACGVTRRPEIGDGGVEGDSAPDCEPEVSEGQAL